MSAEDHTPHPDLRDMRAPLTPETDELRRQWLADEASLREHGANPPGWRAFEAALALAAKMEIKAREQEIQIINLEMELSES